MRTLSSESDLEQLSVDAGIIRQKPRAAYVAETEGDVADGMREWELEGTAVTPRGGGTSIPTQSVGKGVILLQARKNVDVRKDGTAVCQPGVVKADLNNILSLAGRWMPVDPSSYASCTLGGMLANNSSGVRTMKYGATIDYVRELRAVVLGEPAGLLVPVPLEQALAGEARMRRVASLMVENQNLIIGDMPRVTKNSSGYRIERALHDGMLDLPKLLVGSEGTLCVFTQATIATRTPPKWRLLFIVESTLEELDLITEAYRIHSPAALELVDKSVFRMMGRWGRIAKYSRTEAPYLVFCEFDGDSGDATSKAEEVASSRAAEYEPLVLGSQAEISEAWEVRSETLTIAQDFRKGSKILVPGVEDLVVPPERLGDLVRLLTDEFGRRGLEFISYGHAGDANLHSRPLLDPSGSNGRSMLDDLMEDCFEAVWRMGGSMTGEHGDGMLRARYVERQYPRSYWIMQELKKLFDPKGILNPGVKIARQAPP
jgi:FAD/FMN-containing dehydrogenase